MSEPTRKAVLDELQSFLPGGFSRYQQAKAIRDLAESPPGTFKTVGARSVRRRMSQAEAARLVDEAKRRIAVADEDA